MKVITEMKVSSTRVDRQSRRYLLNAYLAVGLGGSCLASPAAGGVVSIDVTGLAGANAGLANGGTLTLDPWPIQGGALQITNGWYGFYGFVGREYLSIGVDSLFSANPTKLALGQSVQNTPQFWSANDVSSLFKLGSYTASPFGPGSYIGFKVSTDGGSTFNYGWIEVTWNGSDTFEILSAAYESTPGVDILAGPAPVPEPASSAVVALLMGGAALRNWRKSRNKQDAQEPSSESLAS
jgi:hypothetical protein